jgi:UDP-glucuronate decarboxylase
MMNPILQQDLKYIYESLDAKEKSMFNRSTILVTGCAGFLGYTILQFFSNYLDTLNIKRIIGLDNFIVRKPAWLAELGGQSGQILQTHQFDISKDELTDVKAIKKVDFVIHMASIASPCFYRKHSIETIDANVWGLRRLLDFYADSNLKGFLFFSSSEIYGDPHPDFIPTPENYFGNVSCNGPRACYDEAKRFGETLCYVYWYQRSVPIVIVRPFNNFGPGLDIEDRRLPADFAKAVLENKDIVILSDGTPTRTFCYVADAVSGYIKALCHGRFDYFNIGTDNPEISVVQFAEIYKTIAGKLFNYAKDIVYKKPDEDDYLAHNPQRRCPSIDKAKKILNYSPKIVVDEGVERYLNFLKLEREKK